MSQQFVAMGWILKPTFFNPNLPPEFLPSELIYKPETYHLYKKTVFESALEEDFLRPWIVKGHTGTGKTTMTVELIREFDGKYGDLKFVYMSMKGIAKRSQFFEHLFRLLLPQSVGLPKKYMKDLSFIGLSQILKDLKIRVLLFIDDAEYLLNKRAFGPDFIHALVRFYTETSEADLKPVLISNKNIVAHLREDTKSSIGPNYFVFKLYNAKDLAEIVKKRVEYCVDKRAFSEDFNEEYFSKYVAAKLVKKVGEIGIAGRGLSRDCLLYTSPSPRDLSTSRMPSSA